MSFIRTLKQQQSHEILKQKRTFMNNTMENEAASPSGRSAEHAHHPKFLSSIEACPG